MDSAFENCAALSSVAWSSGLKSIGKRAFFCCESLEAPLFLPDGLEVIGVNAFAECGFAEIHIPSGVKELKNCTGYFNGDFYIHGMDTKLKVNDFYGLPMTFHAPAGSYAAKCAEKGAFEEFVLIDA